MHQGYIKLYRKVSGNPMWTAEKFTRGQAWIDLIMLTNHKDGNIRVRGVKVTVRRGECGWSVLSLANRWKWSRGKVQRFLDELQTEQQIVQQKNNITTLIKIINYDAYQSSSTTDSTICDAPNGHQTDTNNNEKNDKEDITDKIFELKKRYPHHDLIDSAFSALASTRKSNQIANSVLLAQLEKWGKYPVERVESGIKKYLNGKHYEHGKREEYLLGIIRNDKTTASDNPSTPVWF